MAYDARRYMAAYYAANREERLAYQRAYDASHRAELHARRAIYYAANRELIRARQAAYRQRNLEKARERDRAYYAKNREKKRDQGIAYRAAKAEAIRERKARWRAANPEKARLWWDRLAAEVGMASRAALIAYLVDRDHGRCGICGKPIRAKRGPMRPSPDHVVPVAAGGKDELVNLQLSHWLCNIEKRDGHHRNGRGQQLLLVG